MKSDKINNAMLRKIKKTDLINKRMVAFGDSITAQSTIKCPKTYLNLLFNDYDMKYFENYAIGGTTATYMYKGSNIDKEYHDNTTAIDGCRSVKRAVENHEIDNIDYAFIEFGHNDQFFQPPLDSKDDGSLSLSNCVSFKASYRYMIRMLKKANPKIKIIILNCTYSEYDKNVVSPHGNSLKYLDYRKAIKEIAEEFDCYYLDPWDYLKPYYKGEDRKKYYLDYIHLSVDGHQLLYKFIVNNLLE